MCFAQNCSVDRFRKENFDGKCFVKWKFVCAQDHRLGSLLGKYEQNHFYKHFVC